jgi:hypothetical protein
VLFNRIVEDRPLDHIGIIVEVRPSSILCAEGNVENRTGIFERAFSVVAGYVQLPES